MSKRLVVEFLILALVIAAIGVIPPVRHAMAPALYYLVAGQFGKFQQHLLSLGAWAPAVSIALMIAEAVAIPVTASIVMVANGMVFGVWRGALVSLTGGFIGAVAAYLIGRRFGRHLVGRVLPEKSLGAADRLMAKYGGWALVLERWIPGIPGDPLSYAAGITRMRPLPFVGLTLAGLIPANIVGAFIGDQVVGDVPLPYWLGGLTVVAAGWAAWHFWRRR